MALGARLVYHDGTEVCRIWLSDGLIHSAGNEATADVLMSMYVFAGRRYTPDENGEEWLKAMVGTYRGADTHLELFHADTDEGIRDDVADPDSYFEENLDQNDAWD